MGKDDKGGKRIYRLDKGRQDQLRNLQGPE